MEGVSKIFNSKSTTFLAFCFFVLAGVVAGWFSRGLAHYSLWAYGALFVAAAVVVTRWNDPTGRFWCLAACCLCFGLWRMWSVVPHCSTKDAACFYIGQKVAITAKVGAEPDERSDKTYYIIIPETITADQKSTHAPTGRLRVSAPRYPQLEYGDIIRLSCALHAWNDPKNEASYRNYLLAHGVSSWCTTRDIILKQPASRFSPWYWVFVFKQWCGARVGTLWHEPSASLVAGMLYGDRGFLPRSVSAQFNATGLSHILAVSGFNVTIVATVFTAFVFSLGLWRRQALLIAIIAIALFVIFTGASAAVIRAGVMGALALVAGLAGRPANVARLLLIAATIMVAIQPGILFGDIGFQLSFAATAGLIYLSPPIGFRLGKLYKKFFSLLPATFYNSIPQSIHTVVGEILTGTIGATLATLPIVSYYFGTVSLVAPLANVLVVWTVPFIMAGGALALILSTLFWPLGSAVAFITDLGIHYVLFVVRSLSTPSFSSIQFFLSWWGALAAYGALFLLFVYPQLRRAVALDRSA